MKYPRMVIRDIGTFFPMCWAILRGQYKMPWGTLLWGILWVIYLISPIDTFPDGIPILGITDDGAFAALVLMKIHRDLEAFRQSREQRRVILDAEVVPTDQEHK